MTALGNQQSANRKRRPGAYHPERSAFNYPQVGFCRRVVFYASTCSGGGPQSINKQSPTPVILKARAPSRLGSCDTAAGAGLKNLCSSALCAVATGARGGDQRRGTTHAGAPFDKADVVIDRMTTAAMKAAGRQKFRGTGASRSLMSDPGAGHLRRVRQRVPCSCRK